MPDENGAFVLHLSRARSTPLYVQVADGLAYAISTERIQAGSVLPSLREGQALWDVNLHTVRRAYRMLAERGLVHTERRKGTVVLSAGKDGRPTESAEPVRAFISRFFDEGRERFGADRFALASMVSTIARETLPSATIIECSETLSRMLADQIAATWSVRTIPQLLDGTVPPGTVVSTYFHFNEVRSVAERTSDLAFVHIRPSRAFFDRMASFLAAAAGAPCTLFETDDIMGHNVATDIRAHFGGSVLPTVRVLPATCPPADLETALSATGLKIVSPQLWDRCSSTVGDSPDVVPLGYEIEPRDLMNLGVSRHWAPRP